MTKPALFALAAAALVAGASAQTTTDYQTCDATLVNNLLSILSSPTSALASCLGAATAPFLASAGLPSNTSTAVVLAPFAGAGTPANQTATTFVAALQQTALLNEAWWGVYTGIVNQSAPGVTCTSVSATSTPDFTASNGPCSANPYFAGAWTTLLPTGVTVGVALTDFYQNALPEMFAYAALTPLLTLVPPCLPTKCQTPLIAVCQNPASATAATLIFANMFSSIQSFQSATYAALNTQFGAAVAANSGGKLPTQVNAAFNCSAFGGWGTSLNSTYGGSKGDASSSARVGVLAAAVAVMAAAIAA